MIVAQSPSPGDRAAQAVGEVDVSLLEWYRELSMIERLRAASRAAASLERWRRAASAHG